MRRRAIGDEIDWLTWAISPSGLRTATAQLEGLRIITPSKTACPPIAANVVPYPLQRQQSRRLRSLAAPSSLRRCRRRLPRGSAPQRRPGHAERSAGWSFHVVRRLLALAGAGALEA